MEDWQDATLPKVRNEAAKEKERTGGVSAIPTTLAKATEASVIESLHGLMTTKRVAAGQARDILDLSVLKKAEERAA